MRPEKAGPAIALTLGLLAYAATAAAQTTPFGFTELSRRPTTGQTDPLTVDVSTKGTPPPLLELQDANNWRLGMVTSAGTTVITAKPTWSSKTEMVSLTFPRASIGTADPATVGWRAVYFGPGHLLTASLAAPAGGGAFKAAKGKDDAWFYAFGSILAGPSTKPLYVIDLKLDYKTEARAGWFWNFGASASTNTDAKPPIDEVKVDGDAIAASLSFTKRVNVNNSWLFGLKYSITPFQGEFTRDPFVADWVSAGQVQFNLQPIAHSVTLYPQVGLELGHAIKRPAAIDKQPVDLNGWNGIARLALGGVAHYTLFKADADEDDWYHVTVTGSYTARFLGKPEPSVKTEFVNGARQSVITLDKDRRHLAEASLDWNVMKYTSLSLKYQYGAKAPLFKLVDHQWTLGVTVKAAQK
jgi:hypothetical protein